MTPGDLRKCFYDVIEGATFDSGRAYDDIIDAAGTVLAFAISMLPVNEREEVLLAIEDGSLRRPVERFLGALQCPEVPCGTLN
jgi:hypothetical protein